jgi:hypothetical protein
MLTGRVLKASPSGHGYAAVTLRRDGASRTRYVHHLVASAFLGPRPIGAEICHANGDVMDARAVNLRYDTHNANMRDAIAHGTHRGASKTACVNGHLLTPENTYIRHSVVSDGGTKTKRRCKKCQCAASARYRAARA